MDITTYLGALPVMEYALRAATRVFQTMFVHSVHPASTVQTEEMIVIAHVRQAVLLVH